jgi:hypothetical protein
MPSLQARKQRVTARTPPAGMVVQSKLLLRDLVDLVGFEPTTSSMPWKRAPNCATGPQ